ncbi:MAG: hypothetical protein AAFR71_01060 [Pseudomonadota bacterium]
MGGQNHQPCSKYLVPSTKLSRSVSAARAELELANVSLEDVILSELAGSIGSTKEILTHLHESQSQIGSALDACSQLRTLMLQLDYEDIPEYGKTDIGELGKQMARHGVVDQSAWADVMECRLSGGFFGILRHFEDELTELNNRTQALKNKVEKLQVFAGRGQVEHCLENNLPESIKYEFARLYQKWHSFGQQFLASSMLSTEMWFAFNRLGSMLPDAGFLKRSA